MKSKSVTRSVLEAELFAATNAFDFASTLCVTLNGMFGFVVPLILCSDPIPSIDSVVGPSFTTEKSFLIDLCLLRQNYKPRQLTDVFLIPSAMNSADSMTKQNISPSMNNWMQLNKIKVDA